MIRALCPQCGQMYCWSVSLRTENQKCDDCGCRLLISTDLEKDAYGQSPFNTDMYKVQAVNNADSELTQLK